MIKKYSVWFCVVFTLWSCSDFGSNIPQYPEIIVAESLAIGTHNTGDTIYVDIPVTNVGSENLECNNFKIVGIDSNEFLFDSTFSGFLSLNPDSSSTIPVIHIPADSGSKSASITFDSNVPTRANISIILTAQIFTIAPGIFVTEAVLIDSNFIGDTMSVELSILNTGNAKLLCWNFTFSGINADEFMLDYSGDSLMLEPANTAMLTVNIIPNKYGEKSSLLLWQTNVPGMDSVSIAFSGYTKISYSNEIQPIFNVNCIACHGGSGGLTLTSYNTLMAGNSDHGPVVEPGNGFNSYIVRKLEGRNITGSPMPQGGALTQSQIQSISTWIDEGAKNN